MEFSTQNTTIIANKQVVEDDLETSVEQGTFDLNSSAYLQNMVVDNRSHEETVALYIRAKRNMSKDYKACIQQNAHQSGYIPLNDLKLYQDPKVIWKNTSSIVQAHELIRQIVGAKFLKL